MEYSIPDIDFGLVFNRHTKIQETQNRNIQNQPTFVAI